MADATFQIVFTFSDTTQVAANTKRDNALVDFAKARRLAIYEADGVTVNAALVAPAIRDSVRAALRAEVIAYRSEQAAAVARDASVISEDAALGNP